MTKLTQSHKESIREHNRNMRTRPAHCANMTYDSREWFDACNDAFCEAMEKAGYRKIETKVSS